MSDEDRKQLEEAAKIAILKRIPIVAETASKGEVVLNLAMAYTVLNMRKLPGETRNA